MQNATGKISIKFIAFFRLYDVIVYDETQCKVQELLKCVVLLDTL